jgi:hypothetical protein
VEFYRLSLTTNSFVKLLIINGLNNMPRFLAKCKKSFVDWGLAELMALDSQTYPQVLGISRANPAISPLALRRGEGQNCGLMFHQG